MNRIQSKIHKIGTYNIYKISLSCLGDKRYVLDDGVNTLAYFPKDIKNYDDGKYCKYNKEFIRMERIHEDDKFSNKDDKKFIRILRSIIHKGNKFMRIIKSIKMIKNL